MSSPIPIANVYYLLTYAWNRWEEGQSVDIAGVDSDELVDLLAHVLVEGTRRVLRRGLDRSYVDHDEELSSIRGKIDFGASTKRMLFERARAHCRFDELSIDVLHNRLLRTTIGRLKRTKGVSRRLHDELSVLYDQLDPIPPVHVTQALFSQVQLHRNNASYDLLMCVCELVHASLLPHEGDGRHRFKDFIRDEAMMAKIFEEFVRNFYARHQAQFRVRDEWIDWDGAAYDDISKSALPRMHTDVTLISKDRVIIMDTKYYVEMLKERFDVEKARSTNLYQLFAYLKNAESRGGAWLKSEGILLYPTVTKEIDLRYQIQGHSVRLCTLALNQPWRTIHEQLLGLVKPAAATTMLESGVVS